MSNILVLNAGSSSQKISLFQGDDFVLTEPRQPIYSRDIKVPQEADLNDHADILYEELEKLWTGKDKAVESFKDIDIVGHRVVHGGPDLECAILVSPGVKERIADYAKFAPLQNPYNLLGIKTIEKLMGNVDQVAVFDTGFHATLPAVAQRYPVPYDWFEKFGIRRFGFHGISHYYVSRRAAILLNKPIEQLKIVTCHLGNGCSLAAVSGGKSVDTTMGFSTLDGLMMGSRCGSIDPAIPVYLMGSGHVPGDVLDHALYHQSGLTGISGLSNDMREIEKAAASGHERAELAFNMFIHSLTKEIAAMAASMAGIDALVFTAGIGENSKRVREATCNMLKFLGVELDDAANTSGKGDRLISTQSSSLKALVIQTHEDWPIASESWTLLGEKHDVAR